MTEKREVYSVYTLMSFGSKYDFVYESIKSVAEKISNNEKYDIKIIRADEYLETQGSKVSEIKQRISESDFLIIDFSERGENVMWEFGFAQCLCKMIVPLDCSEKPSPFNISETDKITYELSRNGLSQLEDKLDKVIKDTVDKVSVIRGIMYYDKSIQQYLSDINEYLKSVSKRSIRHKLVENELEMVSKKLASIDSHNFVLKNREPYEDITTYYCDYILQSKDLVSSFSAISCCRFWVTISNGNRNSNYLAANKIAIENGIKLSRVFVISPKMYQEINDKYDDLMHKVLVEHKQWVNDLDGVDVRVLLVSVDDGHSDEEQYYHANNGVLENQDEYLLFQPKYSDIGFMEKTDIWYSNSNNRKSEINTALQKFELVHNRATPISDFDFNSLA